MTQGKGVVNHIQPQLRDGSYRRRKGENGGEIEAEWQEKEDYIAGVRGTTR